MKIKAKEGEEAQKFKEGGCVMLITPKQKMAVVATYSVNTYLIFYLRFNFELLN